MAATKEAAPFLFKLVLGLLIAAVAIPLFVFIAMPNMFFGFSSSETNTVMDMTEKAMALGSVYISLKDFENTQVDSVVTGIVSQYENQGIQIDSVEVDSSFDEDDVLWMIAINSVAYQQDLNAVTAKDIWDLSFSKLSSRPSVSSLISDGDGMRTTLKIRFEKLDPEEMMEGLGFDGEAQTWAGALYELLRDSDALEKYAEYYEPFQTDYSGDSSYDGGYERGDGSSNDIDTSKFIDPYTKNSHDLAAYAIQAWENNWGYVWGTFGNVLTSSVFQYKLEQYPEGVGNYADFIRENWLNHRTADCVGLIKGYGWYDPDTGNIDYGSNGMPDLGADQMYRSAANMGTDYGPMSAMPEIEGLALWKSGHIGVYIGGGYAIEAMGTRYGVVKTEVAGRGWQGWCKLPYIEYPEDSP